MAGMEISFKDKVVFVTGGSRGIGAAIVSQFRESGAKVAFCYKNNHKAAEELLNKYNNTDIKAYKFSVTDFQETTACLRKIREDFGPVDILVNNAGIAQDAFFGMMSENKWHSVLSTTLTGLYNVTRQVITKMISRKSGVIVNISSISGLLGTPGQVNYSTAKAGVIGFSKALAKEYAQYAIRVNCVAPGFIKTDMLAQMPLDVRTNLIKDIPFGRAGEPEEVAHLVMFLCSEYAAYITGQVFVIDGGLC